MISTSFSRDVDTSLVERAIKLQPLLAKNAERTESLRQVVPEVIEALEESGLFEVVVPKWAGGHGATMATQLAVAAELGRACASSAWVQTLINVTTWIASRTPVAEKLFSAGPRPRFCGVLAPSGKAVPVPGGYRVTGQWGFSSGSFCANWHTGGVFIYDEAGNMAGLGAVLVPRCDFTIKDTWFVAGMCGTSSNTVVLEDVFVPAEHIILNSAIGTREAREPADRWSLGSVFALILAGPLLGAARACADIVTQKAPGKPISYTSYSSTKESIVAATEIARAQLDIDTAWLHAFQAAAYIDAVGAGATPDHGLEARLRGQCGYLTAMLRQGVNTLLDVGSAASFASSNIIQRHWRDINVGSRHAFLSTNISYETYGRSLFGLDPVLLFV
jgi:alkylation response protein AidB-like acyl-CoA dehydrogenase